MKLLTFLSLFIACVVTVHGQANVNFVNRTVGGILVNAPVYGANPLNPLTRLSGNANTNGGTIDYTGATLLLGTGFTASLWAAPVEPGVVPPVFQQLATTTFRTLATLPGYIQPQPNGLAVVVPFITQPGTPAQFQVRAWDNMNATITTWAGALANSAIRPLGASDTFTLTPRFVPDIPSDLIGLTSFNLTIVPEPSTLAFGLVGTLLVGAWRFRRRQ